jgi:hypothetical protein
MKTLGTFLLAALVLLVVSTPARASIDMYYSLDGGATITAFASPCAAGLDTAVYFCAGISLDGGKISITAVSASGNAPGAPGIADQIANSLLISSTEAKTLHIYVLAQDFMMPSAPPNPGLTYDAQQSGTTLGNNTSTSFSTHSCIDTTNGNVAAFSLGCGGGTLTNTSQTITTTSTPTDDVRKGISSLTGPWAFEQDITIDLTVGSNISLNTTQSLIPTPEPAAMMLMGTLLMGVGFLVRKTRSILR